METKGLLHTPNPPKPALALELKPPNARMVEITKSRLSPSSGGLAKLACLANKSQNGVDTHTRSRKQNFLVCDITSTKSIKTSFVTIRYIIDINIRELLKASYDTMWSIHLSSPDECEHGEVKTPNSVALIAEIIL